MDATLCYEKTDEEKREDQQKKQEKIRQEKIDRGRAIARLLDKKKIKNKEVAEWLGWDDPHQVSRLKAGKAGLELEEAYILKKHLGVSIKFFFLSSYDKEKHPLSDSMDEEPWPRPPDEDEEDEDMELVPVEELSEAQSKLVLEFQQCARQLLKMSRKKKVPIGLISKTLYIMKGLVKKLSQ